MFHLGSLSKLYLVCLAFVVREVVGASVPSHSAPTATVRNGSLQGLYSAQYDQDFFLGIPYAQPPLESLRYNLPHSLNTSWSGIKDALAYSPECVGYGVSTVHGSGEKRSN
jgi:carboxylesterase type B